MKIKKIFSGILCASMILSSFTFVNAENTAEMTDYWNYNLVSESTKALYTQFPMTVDKTIGKNMSMSMRFQYLKNISANDAVEVIITDLNNNIQVGQFDLNCNKNSITLNDVENDKNFSIEIYENLGGVNNTYIGYISTKYVKADFPVNMSFNGVSHTLNQGEQISNVAMKKVGADVVCEHEDDADCTDACKSSATLQIIEINEFDSFYSDLESNCFYEMQFESTYRGNSEHHQGFISTYPGGENMGIFTRGYSFSLTPTATVAENMVAPCSFPIAPVSPDDYDLSTATDYLYYENKTAYLDYDSDYLVRWVVPETGTYTIEMIGNLDTQWYEFYVNSTTGQLSDTAYAQYDGGTGENAASTITILQGETIYFVLNTESGDGGQFAFRIKRDDYSNQDGISGYRDEVQAMYDAGTYSPVTNSCRVDYDGDVNIFAYNASKGEGLLCFENVDVDLKADIYTIYGRTGGFDTLWKETTISIDGVDEFKKYPYTFTKQIHYIDIKQQSVPASSNPTYYDGNSYTYDFDFYDAKRKDTGEALAHPTYGDNPVYPTNITFPYSNTTRTIHSGDSDWYKFSVAENGGKLTVKLYETYDEKQYDVYLYDNIVIRDNERPTWVESSNIGVIETKTGYKEMTYEGLLTGRDYYIKVKSSDSNVFSSLYPYTIEASVATASPTAVLSGNVTISHILGSTVNDLSNIKDTVMDSLTCSLYGETVADTDAVDDVDLYYNDAILTADIVNSLSVGTYTIVPKYNGVAATGGTVVLNVISNPSQEQVIMLANVPTEHVNMDVLDWAAVARIVANTRLMREGPAQTSYSVQQAVMAVKSSGYNIRGTIEEVVKAANYFYSGGSQDTYNFINNSVDVTTAEYTLSNALSDGQSVVMQLTSISNPADLTAMRYVVLCGINLTTHEYIVFDPVLNQTITISQNIMHNGGYNGNSDLRFTGQVVEFF